MYNNHSLHAHDMMVCIVEESWRRIQSEDICKAILTSDGELNIWKKDFSSAMQEQVDPKNPNRKYSHAKWDKIVKAESCNYNN